MSSKRVMMILNVGIGFSLLLFFNSCGEGTYINPADTSGIEESGTGAVPVSSAAPKLTASTYQVQSGQATTLSVSGGEAPFTYTVSPSSAGSVNSNNRFVANQPGVSSIEVTDSVGRKSEIAIDIRAARTSRTLGNNH